MLLLMRSLEAFVSQAIEAAGHVLEPLMVAYQDAMSCVHALCAWLADDYLINMQDMTHDVEASSCRQPNAAMMGERTAFGRVLSLLGSLATSHTVDLRPGVINVVFCHRQAFGLHASTGSYLLPRCCTQLTLHWASSSSSRPVQPFALSSISTLALSVMHRCTSSLAADALEFSSGRSCLRLLLNSREGVVVLTTLALQWHAPLHLRFSSRHSQLQPAAAACVC